MGFSVHKESISIPEDAARALAPLDIPFSRNGFTIQFAGGHRVSVQFGTHNLCPPPDEHGYATHAEVAVLAPDGEWATRAVWAAVFSEELGDDVAADVTPERLVDVLVHVRDWLEANHG